jgi:hypothetical protein
VNKMYIGCSWSCISGIFQTTFNARYFHNSPEKFLWTLCFYLLQGRTSLPTYWTAHPPVCVSCCGKTVIVDCIYYRPTLPVAWTYL